MTLIDSNMKVRGTSANEASSWLWPVSPSTDIEQIRAGFPEALTPAIFRSCGSGGSSTQLIPIPLAQMISSVIRTTQTGQGATRWGEYVYSRLSRLRSGIDREDNETYPDSATVDRAHMLVENLFEQDTPTPSVVPGESGEVVFVWHKRGLDVAIEVSRNETTFWAYSQDRNWSKYGSLEDVLHVASQVLHYLSSL